MLKIKSVRTKNLTKSQINSICILKNSYWKFGKKSQRKWFNENIKNEDIHNLLFFKNKLVAYTALRKKSFIIKNKLNKYLLFDTLLVNKKYRRKKFSEIITKFNGNIIKKNKKISFLICNHTLVKYYEKYGWKKLNNKKFLLLDYMLKNKSGLIYNCNIKSSIFKFFINN